MAMEDTFNGAKNAFAFLDAYINTVAQEIGMERALGLYAEVCEAMGAQQGQMVKEQAGIEEFDAKAAYSVSKGLNEGLGISWEATEESPQCVVFKVGRCPVYEASQMIGMDAEAIETSCRASGLHFMDALVKQLNPDLNYQLRKFRSGADDFCEEAIVLA